MKAINKVRGDVRREVVKTHTLSDQNRSSLSDIYADLALEENLRYYEEEAAVVNPLYKAQYRAMRSIRWGQVLHARRRLLSYSASTADFNGPYAVSPGRS